MFVVQMVVQIEGLMPVTGFLGQNTPRSLGFLKIQIGGENGWLK